MTPKANRAPSAEPVGTGLPAKNAPRLFRYYASSFIAGKPRSYRFCTRRVIVLTALF